MIILESDNRVLTNAAKYTYTITNIASGVSSFSVLNATDSAYATNAYLLLSLFGAEDAEIVQISTVNNDTGLITLASPTLFPHTESARVTVIPYNQIRFFHTATDTFSTGTPLAGYLDIQPNDWFTTYNDETNASGYGWFCFYNLTTTTLSSPSNAIPYTGFTSDTTEKILADFFSMLGNKELRLVTREDALSWASEGYGRMRNKLNLTNSEFSSSGTETLDILPSVIEYDLPTDFDHLVALVSGLSTGDPGSWGGSKENIEFIPLKDAYSYMGSTTRYYIRGFKIGILPTPSIGTTFHYLYLKKALRLSLNTDEVILPNGGEYVLGDWLLYRAYQKFQNPQFKVHFEAFTEGLNDMIISSIKRDAHLPTWGIDRYSNV